MFNPMLAMGEDDDEKDQQMLMPNTPRDPDREAMEQEKVKSYLQGRMRPDRSALEPLNENNRDLAFTKFLMDSANQVGTVGGKTASSQPFGDLTKNLIAQNQATGQRFEADRKDAAADEDRQLKLMNYFEQKNKANEALDYRRSRDEKTDDYRKKLLEAQTERRDSTQKDKHVKDDRDFSFKLSKEYGDNKTTANTEVIRQMNEKARSAASNPSPANDMSLVYALMRINDPNSTVREGEFAMGTNLGSIDQKILSLRDKALKGTMEPSIRQGILQSIEDLSMAQEKSQRDIDAYYDDQAKRWQVDPELVIGKRRSRFKEPDQNVNADPTRPQPKAGGLLHGGDLP